MRRAAAQRKNCKGDWEADHDAAQRIGVELPAADRIAPALHARRQNATTARKCAGRSAPTPCWAADSTLVGIVRRPQFPFLALLDDHPGKDASPRWTQGVVRIAIPLDGPVDVHKRNVGVEKLDGHVFSGKGAVPKLRAV